MGWVNDIIQIVCVALQSWGSGRGEEAEASRLGRREDGGSEVGKKSAKVCVMNVVALWFCVLMWG